MEREYNTVTREELQKRMMPSNPHIPEAPEDSRELRQLRQAEQRARDLLERMDVDEAQSFSAGKLAELAHLIMHNKQLGKALGIAGQRVHERKCELAEVREINGKIARNYVRELERQARADATRIDELQARSQRLAEQWVEMRDKLDAAEGAGSYEFDQSYEPDPGAAGHDYSDGPPVS